MSSYESYCQDQAAECARRARLASSPEIVAYCRTLELRWLKLAEQAQETGGALGHESGPTATLLPLRDRPATYPVEYGKRAGELIARGARSLHRSLTPPKERNSSVSEHLPNARGVSGGFHARGISMPSQVKQPITP
jgi:hypothetical protein